MILHQLKASRGLGKPVSTPLACEAMRQAGLDWEIEKRPLMAMLSDGRTALVEQSNALVRTTDRKVLGTVGNVYHVVQNIETFSFFDCMTINKLAHYHSAGSFREGKLVWLLAKLLSPMEVGKDLIEKYILFSNSHDGKHTIRASFLPVRASDGNICSVNLQGSTPEINIRHSRSPDNSEGVETLHGAVEHYSEYARCAHWLAQFEFNEKRMTNFLRQVFPPKRKFETRQNTAINLIINLFHQETMPGTAWAAWMAICAYCCEYKLVHRETGEKRLESLWLGNTAKFRQMAFDALQKEIQCA
jgi:phage/plasmid-like protein (TIGR03299 family)